MGRLPFVCCWGPRDRMWRMCNKESLRVQRQELYIFSVVSFPTI
jgi:hypothetical protein